jgi:hypothetical protein
VPQERTNFCKVPWLLPYVTTSLICRDSYRAQKGFVPLANADVGVAPQPDALRDELAVPERRLRTLLVSRSGPFVGANRFAPKLVLRESLVNVGSEICRRIRAIAPITLLDILVCVKRRPEAGGC